MEFSRMGEHQVRCLIQEQEIIDMGFSIEDILKNGAETQKFMNRILKMAERQLDLRFAEGVKTVRADFMDNHVLSLTFSALPVDNFMEHIKDLIGGAIAAASSQIPPEELEELIEIAEEEKEREAAAEKKVRKPLNGKSRMLAFAFADFDTIIKVAGIIARNNLPELPEGELYKFEEEYYLILSFDGISEKDSIQLALQLEEFSDEMVSEMSQCAFLREHGKPVIRKDALEQLLLF